MGFLSPSLSARLILQELSRSLSTQLILHIAIAFAIRSVDRSLSARLILHIAIAFAIRSVDRSLSTQLILQDYRLRYPLS